MRHVHVRLKYLLTDEFDSSVSEQCIKFYAVIMYATCMQRLDEPVNMWKLASRN